MTEQAAVYVVDDDEMSRKSVIALVSAMGVDAQGYDSAEGFLAAYQGHRPACVVTDLRMVGMSGVELQEELLGRGVRMPVIVMTAFASTQTTVRAMRNGAVTLLEKPCNENELWEAIRDALATDLETQRLEAEHADIRQKLATLSDKERSVLECMVAGDANKVTARRLDVSVRTVENHRRKIFEKMEADSLAELVRKVMAVDSGSE
ncbi:MAG: response regulator transcription factor [Planctomycetales bacterium]|nr:response regulator transcription factor [Planctomycetales bacterium]